MGFKYEAASNVEANKLSGIKLDISTAKAVSYLARRCDVGCIKHNRVAGNLCANLYPFSALRIINLKILRHDAAEKTEARIQG